MKRLSLILLIVFVFGGLIWGQTKADELFSAREYARALVEYEALNKNYPQTPLYEYRLARCYQETGQVSKAIYWFEVAGERYTLRNYYLAKMYVLDYQFEKAVTTIERYIAAIDEDNDNYQSALQLKQYAQLGQRYIQRVEDISLIDSVIVPKDDFLKAYRLSAESGKLSIEDKEIIFVTSRQDRQIKGEVLLGAATTEEKQESSLVSCHRLLDEWTECDTIPEPINGDYNVSYPFMLSDGVTMYFASDMDGGLGGFDIYKTRYNNNTNTWLAAENIGFPFNSAANDYMFAVDEQAGIGVFATDRRTSADSVGVYRFKINEGVRVLRDATDEYIRLAAQLLTWRHAEDSEDPDNVEYSDNPELSDSSVYFIIDNNTIYTSLDEFQTAQGRKLAEQYIALEEEIEAETQSLESDRAEYKDASDTRKEELKALILTKENTLRTLRAERNTLLKQIRQAEL